MTDLDDLRKLAPRVPRARQRMIDNLPGYPSAGDVSSRNIDTEGGRTAALALRATMSTDPAVRDLARLDRLCPDGTTRQLERFHEAGAKITKAVSELHELCNRWAPTEQMVDGLRGETLGKGDTGCRSCRRYKPDGRPTWSEVHGHGLCRFCLRALARVAGLYEWDQDLPPLGVVEWHHQTGKYLRDEVIHRVMHGKKRRAEA